LKEAVKNQPLQLLDVTGKLVYTEMIQSTQSTIDVSELNQGIYFLRIGNQTKRVVIAR
jgi:hypothetical protein